MKNALYRALALTMALVFAGASPALAGVPISDVHYNGKVIFVQAPDGTYIPAQADASGNTAISGSISATLAGFTPNGNVASLSVTTSSANVALPAGTVVLVTNTGTTNTAFIKLSVGAGTAAATDMALVAGATVGLTVGSNTFINAITSSSTTTLRMAGGTGLVSGYGGGGGSGGGGAVTIADAADVTLGAKADAKSTATDTTAVTAMQVLKQISASVQAPPTQAVTIATAPVLVAGSALIGKVGIDQTTPGTTNGVYVTNNGSAQGAAIAAQTPSTIACQVLTSGPSVFTTATTQPCTEDEYGGVLTHPYALQDRLVKGTTSAMTGTTSTSLVAAPGAGLKNYITTLSCVNSHATVGTFVTVQDGSGGTAIWTVAAAALFGGTAITFPAPLQQPTANTALYVADVTTGANVICSASGYKAP